MQFDTVNTLGCILAVYSIEIINFLQNVNEFV